MYHIRLYFNRQTHTRLPQLHDDQSNIQQDQHTQFEFGCSSNASPPKYKGNFLLQYMPEQFVWSTPAFFLVLSLCYARAAAQDSADHK